MTTMHFNENASVLSIIPTCIDAFALKVSIQRTGFQRNMNINSNTQFRGFEKYFAIYYEETFYRTLKQTDGQYREYLW